MMTQLRSSLITATFLALAACGGAPIPPPAAALEKPAAATDDASLCQDAAVRLLGALREPMTITVHATRSIPEFDAAARRIEGLLVGYAQRTPGKLALRILDTETLEHDAIAREAELVEGTFAVDASRSVRGFLGLVLTYRDQKEVVPSLDPTDLLGIEHMITSRIRQIEAEADAGVIRVGVVTSKLGSPFEEHDLVVTPAGGTSPTVQGIFAQAAPYYKLEPVSLDGGDIDPSLRAVVLAQPSEDLGDAALARIDRFLMLGDKGLLVLAGAANLRAGDTAMNARLDTHRVEKLLRGYGVELGRDLILDWARPALVKVPTKDHSDAEFPYPPILVSDHDGKVGPEQQRLDTSFPVFFRIDELALAFPSTLKVAAGRQPEARIRVVARSSPKATVVTTDTVNLEITSDLAPAGEFATRDVAVTVEGRLRSAFPAAGAAPETSRRADRILVIAAAQFATNPYARASNPPPLPPQMAMMQAGEGAEDLRMLAQPYAQKYLTGILLALKNSFDWMTTDGDDLRACGELLRRDDRRAK